MEGLVFNLAELNSLAEKREIERRRKEKEEKEEKEESEVKDNIENKHNDSSFIVNKTLFKSKKKILEYSNNSELSNNSEFLEKTKLSKLSKIRVKFQLENENYNDIYHSCFKSQKLLNHVIGKLDENEEEFIIGSMSSSFDSINNDSFESFIFDDKEEEKEDEEENDFTLSYEIESVKLISFNKEFEKIEELEKQLCTKRRNEEVEEGSAGNIEEERNSNNDEFIMNTNLSFQ